MHVLLWAFWAYLILWVAMFLFWTVVSVVATLFESIDRAFRGTAIDKAFRRKP